MFFYIALSTTILYSQLNLLLQVYMVLDGHDGLRACEFARKHLPTAFLKNVIHNESSLLESLRKAFFSTEREFFAHIDPHITRKRTLQFEIDVRLLE